MKLIVGGYYVTRDGRTTRVARCDDDPDFPFDGENGQSYGPNGHYWGEGGREHGDDLIREATPDEVIAYCAGKDAQFPTVDDVVDAEFRPDAADESRAEAWIGKTASEHAAAPETYADLFDARTTISHAEPWEGSAAQAREIERFEINNRIGRSVAFRNLATAAMQIMLGIAAILFAASGYVQ